MTISVLQWNIWYKEPIENIAAFLLETKADIICLQEAMHNYPEQSTANSTKYLAEKLGYNYYEKAIEIEGKDWLQGNALLTRFPITKQRSVWINEPTGVGGYDDEHRAYVETVVDVHGKPFTVATVHMSYTKDFEITIRKRAETDRLLNLVKHQGDNYVLTGDLNALPDSYTVRQLEKRLKNAGPDYGQNTWTTKPFSYEGLVVTELEWRIDYIFANKKMKVKSASVLNTDYSDHLPVLAIFELS